MTLALFLQSHSTTLEGLDLVVMYSHVVLVCVVLSLLGALESKCFSHEFHLEQATLLTQYEMAADSVDFALQLEILQKLSRLNSRFPDEPTPVTQHHLDFMLRDVRRAVHFTAQELEVAKKRQQYRIAALRSFEQGEIAKAFSQMNEAIDSSRQVFGDSSFHTLELQSCLANKMQLSNFDRKAAIELAHCVLEVLQRDSHQDCFIYCQIHHTLAALYIDEGEFDKASGYGEIACRQMEEMGVTRTVSYINLQGGLAAVLNLQKRHDEAVAHARKGLNAGLIPDGTDVKYYVRLLREYARGKVAVDDYERVPEAFEEMIRIAKATPNYPDFLLLEHLREYDRVANAKGWTDRKQWIAAEMSQLK